MGSKAENFSLLPLYGMISRKFQFITPNSYIIENFSGYYSKSKPQTIEPDSPDGI